jgi:hypothetical protein
MFHWNGSDPQNVPLDGIFNDIAVLNSIVNNQQNKTSSFTCGSASLTFSCCSKDKLLSL